MLQLLKEDLTASGVFSGELPPFVKQLVSSINAPQIPYRFKLTIAMSELVLFASHLRRNIIHWNGSHIPINTISFVVAGSGAGKDSSVSAVRKCFDPGYKILETKRKEIAAKQAIKLAMVDGKENAEEWNTYKDYYTPPNPLFVAPSTSEGFIQHLNDLESAGIGAGFLVSGEIGAEMASGGLIIDNIKLLAEIYDEGNKEVKVLKNRENQSREIKGLPVSALFMGSPENLLYDDAIKRVFKREFSTKLARRSFFTFTPIMEPRPTYDYIPVKERIAYMEKVELDQEDYSIKCRKEAQDIIKEVAEEAIKSVGQSLTVSEEVRSIFTRYKHYNEELAFHMSPQYPISRIVRSHMQWKAFKLSGALAIMRGHGSIEKEDYISAVSYCESISEDMQLFEIELVKEPYEIFTSYMHSIALEGKSNIGLHQLRKMAYISSSGSPLLKMQELVHLATSYDKDGIYSICEDGICFELIHKTATIGCSYLEVTGTKEERQYQCVEGYQYYQTTFDELALMLQEDLAYTPFQFKDGKRGKDYIISGAKWIVLDIDDSYITDEEAHFLLQDINHHIARTSKPDNAFKFRILLELDAVVTVTDMQWKPFIKSIADSLSLTADLLPKAQIYFSYADRKVLSVTDQQPIGVKEHLIAASLEAKPLPPKPNPKQAKALLGDPMTTFAKAFEAEPGNRYRSLISAALYAKDLGATKEECIELINDINDFWDEPASSKAVNSVIQSINRWR